MTYHLAPVQPLWSFASAIHLAHVAVEAGNGPAVLSPPVQGWSAGPDGRPRTRWAVGRAGVGDY